VRCPAQLLLRWLLLGPHALSRRRGRLPPLLLLLLLLLTHGQPRA